MLIVENVMVEIYCKLVMVYLYIVFLNMIFIIFEFFCDFEIMINNELCVSVIKIMVFELGLYYVEIF